MDNRMDIKTNGSTVWPYIVLGSAIGGAVGYLFMTESGRKIRYSITHPDELANDLEGAGSFVEKKARVVTNQVHGILDRAKRSIEEGQYAYREAGQQYRSRIRQVESKNSEITSTVHNTVDRMSRTAVTVEQSVLDPICELGALYRGLEQGIRALLGKTGHYRPLQEGPIPIHRDRVMGS